MEILTAGRNPYGWRPQADLHAAFQGKLRAEITGENQNRRRRQSFGDHCEAA